MGKIINNKTIMDIRESIAESQTIVHDRRGKKNYIENDIEYIKKIWRAYDTSTISPELEFCETKEQADMWLYYRDISSSFDRNNNGGLKIKRYDCT